MYIKRLDLIVAIILALLNFQWTLHHGRTPAISIVLALPIVFFLPGYTLLRVLIRRGRLNAIRCVLFSMAISIALDILSGFILNLLPSGLNALSWAICLGGQIVAYALLAELLQIWRRDTLVNINWLQHMFQPMQQKKLQYAVVFSGLLLSLFIVIFSLLFSANSAANQQRAGFTQLWMLRGEQPDKSCMVQVGIESFELTPVTYTVTLTINGAPSSSWSSITLEPQKTWNTSILVASKISGNFFVEAQLYRADQPSTVYRNVHITLHSLGQKQHEQQPQCTR